MQPDTAALNWRANCLFLNQKRLSRTLRVRRGREIRLWQKSHTAAPGRYSEDGVTIYIFSSLQLAPAETLFPKWNNLGNYKLDWACFNACPRW